MTEAMKDLTHGHSPKALAAGMWIGLQHEQMVPLYAKELPADPCGRPYAQYTGDGGYAVVFSGPDGQLGTADDIRIVVPNPTSK
jgi:hypothetical protein